MKRLVLSAVFLGVAGVAQASPWTILDLGRTDREAHCLEASERTLEGLLAETRIKRLYASDWVNYADGINGAHDVAITCTFGDARGTRATLVIHSTGRWEEAIRLKRRINHLFTDHARRIRRAWVDSFK